MLKALLVLAFLWPSIAMAEPFRFSIYRDDTAPTATHLQNSYFLNLLTSLHYKVRVGGYWDDKRNIWIADKDGDCQRKTAWVMKELLKKGFPPASMRGYIGKYYDPVQKKELDHAWLVVAIILPNGEPKTYIVDFVNETILESGQAKGYRGIPRVRIVRE